MRFSQLPTPCYVIDEDRLIQNLEILKSIEDASGCRILLAQKAFSCFYFYPLISQYLSGTTASGLYEAKLAHEEFKGENHIFSPAYKEEEFGEILSVCDHIVFNSFSQLDRFGARAKKAGVSFGMRVNPMFSTQGGGIYDPCARYSRLGVLPTDPQLERLSELDGIHFHTLCEQGAEPLKETILAAENAFGPYMKKAKWINLGGGHHITKPYYDRQLLIDEIKRLQDKYGAMIYLEPGEAIALDAGYLVSSVVDITRNEMNIALLDTSAECHMPDVLEMPYRPQVAGAGEDGEKPYSYRLSSCTCLAGDVIGDYSFDNPLMPGDRLVFLDMAIYTMVKNNTFNGMPLPAIAVKKGDECKVIKAFGYGDFKSRL
ncbi:MAG: carboxynorspermidine decarboxylase [Clostridia bacterium]|nr:carboxynorspermidine decarboxylase [Clostridia bacterium]